MSRVPLRVRLTAACALVMAVVLATSGVFLYQRLAGHLSDSVDRDLRLRAQDLAALVREPGGQLSATARGRLVESGESYAQLLDTDGRVLAATPPLAGRALLTPPERTAARRGPLTAERRSVPGLDEPSRLLAAPVVEGHRRLVLVVGETLQDRAETLAAFRDELLLAGPLALLAAGALGYVLAGLALRPVERMRRQAARISAETAGERLPQPRTRDELERLAATLNDMLDRLQAALDARDALIADAGHELRTPLALLRTELELGLRHADSVDELRATLAGASREAARLSQLAEDLLLIARSDRGELELRVEPLAVDDLLATLESRYAWRSESDGKEVRVAPAGELRVLGDRLRLEQALGNLVENALRHGGTQISLAATAHNGLVELHVRDDGTGFPDGFLERAFERFSRADAGRAAGGAGLGLAIVRTIAEAHGGRAGAANAADGGADVWVGVPRASG